MAKKKRDFWASVGILMIIFGAIGSIIFGVRGELSPLIITGAMIIAGILIFSWVFGD